MSIRERFIRDGIKYPIDNLNKQILNDPKYVWMVDKGKMSIFLTTQHDDNPSGENYFLFEAGVGELLFGIAPEKPYQNKYIIASGIVGSSLIRLEAARLIEELDGEAAKEINLLIHNWLYTLSQVMNKIEPLTGEAASFAAEIMSIEGEYLTDNSLKQEYDMHFLQVSSHLWEEQKLMEKKRLKEKIICDNRQLASSISRLAILNEKEKNINLIDLWGNNLLDACSIVGKRMNIKIEPPPKKSAGLNGVIHLDDIARASRIRTREVELRGTWFKRDNGPILSFMKEDNRPVALIPVSPSKYILHDIAKENERVIDEKTSEQIKSTGYIFYRPLPANKITLWDLILYGIESTWKKDLVMVVLMGILAGLLGTAIPFATGIIFDSIIPESDINQLLQVTLILFAAAIATMLFQFTRSLAMLRIEGKMDSSLQSAVWDRLISLSVPFFKQFSAGELALRAMSISRIRMVLSGITLNTILSSIFSIFTFLLLFYYDTRLAWIATLLVCIAVITMGYLGFRQIRFARKVLDVSNRISGLMLQYIGGITKFRVAGAEKRVFSQWANEFTKQRNLSFQRDAIGNKLTTFNSFFQILVTMVIFYALTSGTESLSPGKFIGFYAAFTTFLISMFSLSEALISSNIIIPLYQRAKPILDTIPEYDETKENPKTLTGSIEVSHLSFRYREDGPFILKDISFQINEGDYVGLVGTSGCGKSTLLRLLLGFEKPEAGKIYFNGQDLSKVDIRLVRKQLGVVLQNGQLMTGDIYSNIVGGNPFLTLDDAWEAARLVGLEEDIKAMPMGMHTIIGEGASSISTGQKQSIMIARAIINKPKILFFDEATSSLDNHSQSIVSKSLDSLKVTRIVIAHRLSTIIHCNKILVMDRGKIVESGTYQELMDKGGIFADLAKRQLA